MKYKCVIFDCDGVLVDSESISSKVLVEMAENLGVNLSYDEAVAEFSGKSFKGISEYIDFRVDGDLPSNFEMDFRQKTFRAFKKNLEPIKGIHEVLDGLKVPFCVASSGPREKITLNLTKVNLINKFSNDSIFSSYEIGSWKPDPGIYLFAAKKMGYKPSECAVVEDSMYGVTAAIAGGFDTFAYAKRHNKGAFEDLGAVVFDSMEDLDDLLGR
ncbi:MAG: HAD family hydrolase [Maribacter sp.]|nr:HAD family hydrolase [Maribacter sp.]